MEPRWSVSKTERFPKRLAKQPGPGEYTPPSKMVEGPRFTTRPKPLIDPFKNKTKPGPGLYNPPTSAPFKNLSFSITATNNVQPKESRLKELNTPGPGSYSATTKPHYSSLVGSKIGSASRKSFFLTTGASGKPDPGNYNKLGFGKIDSNPRYSFGKSSRP